MLISLLSRSMHFGFAGNLNFCFSRRSFEVYHCVLDPIGSLLDGLSTLSPSLLDFSKFSMLLVPQQV